MFYLKYRPRTLSELDNSNVSQVLTNILQSQPLPHSFLFVGQKGTGKTSAARIFAKAVNCLENRFAHPEKKNLSVEPCNKCANCLSIANGTSPDVMEMDAASNRGIDEIRSLIHDAAFSPISGKYRVFIIDEAHMITTDAFNALLKTLEEPPPSVIFILATTNEEKVPKTIISRCFRVNFGSAKLDDVKRMIQRVAKGEQLTIDPQVVDLIAAHSDRSFRDTTKILEELAIQSKLDLEAATEYLGTRSKEGLLELIQKDDIRSMLKWVNDYAQAGGSIRYLIEDVLQELHVALMARANVIPEDEASIQMQASDISFLMKQLHEAYAMLRSAPIESIPLEIALVEFYNRKAKK